MLSLGGKNPLGKLVTPINLKILEEDGIVRGKQVVVSWSL